MTYDTLRSDLASATEFNAEVRAALRDNHKVQLIHCPECIGEGCEHCGNRGFVTERVQ